MKLNSSFNSKINWQVADPSSGAADPAVPVNTGPDLSFIPADYHVDGKPDVAKFAAHYQETIAEQARTAEQKAAVPEAYEFAIPADLKFEGLPADYALELDTADPLFGELGGVLKQLGAPAEAAGKLTGLLAKYQAGKDAADYAAWQKDMAQLGTADQQAARSQDVLRKLETLLPADQAKALFSGDRISADGIRALEKLLSGRGMSAPPASPQGQDIENLTPMQKLQLANRQRA
jgi:hypothetical protein